MPGLDRGLAVRAARGRENDRSLQGKAIDDDIREAADEKPEQSEGQSDEERNEGAFIDHGVDEELSPSLTLTRRSLKLPSRMPA